MQSARKRTFGALVRQDIKLRDFPPFPGPLPLNVLCYSCAKGPADGRPNNTQQVGFSYVPITPYPCLRTL